MNKQAIIAAAEKSFSAFTRYCNSIPGNAFFEKPGDKWSVAENVQHLIISTNMSTLAFSLPRFIVRWISGRPNRGSKTYDQLAGKYEQKLAAGGAATGRYIPKPITITATKERLLLNWEKATGKHLTALKNNRSEKDLDNYLVKHPLLGKITLRELCYFTIYHTEHHLNIISSRAVSL
jgi:hypothetical protein